MVGSDLYWVMLACSSRSFMVRIGVERRLKLDSTSGSVMFWQQNFKMGVPETHGGPSAQL